MPHSTQGKSFQRLCARFGAVIIVDFYINDLIIDFIVALFIFMTDDKAVNTACRDNFITENAVFSREAGKRSTTGYKSYFHSHIVQITDFLDFLHEYCEEKSETFTEFLTYFVLTRTIKIIR